METAFTGNSHTILIKDRETLSITGVKDTSNFDEESLVFDTTAGRVEIKGEKLHVTKLSLETGDMEIEGILTSISYFDSPVKTSGFFRKVFS